jgi:hypothetical protein
MKRNPRRANNDRYYTAQEAGRFFGMTAETVKKKCRDGKIKGTQIGTKSQWHIQGSEINRKIVEWKLNLISR